MKRAATALFVATALLGGTSLRAATPDDPGGRAFRVEQWLKAVRHHSPGSPDEPLVDIATWSSRELALFRIDADTLVRLMRDPRLTSFQTTPKEADCGDCLGRRDTGQPRILPRPQRIPYTDAQVHRLRVLACAAAGMLPDLECVRLKASKEIDDELTDLAHLAEASRARGDNNFIVKRGALLHADLAIVNAGELRPIDGRGQDGAEPTRIHMADGQQTAIGLGEIHWEIGRMLLDRVTPEHDAMVSLWYRATAAWMQRDSQYDAIHLSHARAMFPSDADLAFLSGTESETYAGASIQAFVKSAVLPTGIVVDIRSEGAELRTAESYLRRAVQLNPAFVEARVRLGHVLLARGKPQDAANELRTAVAADSEPLLQYFSGMFLGAAEEALGHFADARESYTRASALYPRAQSAHLALSALATRLGDRAGALAAIRPVFDLTGVADDLDDPWWTYYRAQGRNAEELLTQLRQPFLEAQP